MPRPDSRPGTRHQPSNPANHRPSAPGPHRGSRGTYGARRVVPRPEGPGEDGVLPGNRGCSGDGVPRWCASSQPGDDLNRGPGVLSLVGPLRPFGPPPPEGGGLRVCGLGQPRPSRSERERQRTKRRIWHLPIDSPSPEPIDAQTRQPARDKAPAVEPCVPSPVGTGPAQGVQGDVRSEASSPPAGGARGGRSSPRKQGVFGGRSPPLVRQQSAWSQPQPWTRCSVSGGPPPPASQAPPPEGGGLRVCGLGQPRPSRSERERQRTKRRIWHQPIDSPRKAVDTVFCRWSARLLRVGDP